MKKPYYRVVQDLLYSLFVEERDYEHAHAHSSDLLWRRYVRDVDYISKKIKKGASVLDAGCGAGHIAAYLSAVRPDLNIVGIDIEVLSSWNLLRKNNCIFRRGNVLKTSFHRKFFDYIIAFGVIEHVNFDKAIGNTKKDYFFLKEMHRILKDGGSLFLVNIPSKNSLTEFISDKFGIGSHEQKYGKSEIYYLAHKSGFSVVEIRLRDFIPAQLGRISTSLETMFNKISNLLFFLDEIICITPLQFFSQNYFVELKKLS